MSSYDGVRDLDHKQPSHPPVRAKEGLCNVIAFAVMAAVSLIVIVAIALWTSRQSQINENQITIENLAQTIGHHTDATIKQADVVLHGVVQSIAEEGMSPEYLKRLGRLLVQQRTQLPQVQDFFVLNAAGDRVVTANPLIPVINWASETSYFAYHQISSNPEPYIGPPYRNRTNNDWMFTVSRRISYKDGSFAGVVLATISIRHFLSLYAGLDTSQDRTMGLVLRNGTLLWRLPFKDADVGTSIAAGPLFSTYLRSATKGTASIRSKLDGIDRLVSFVTLSDYPLVVYVGRSKQEVLSQWRKNSVVFALIVLGMLSVLAIFSYRLGMLIRNQGRADQQLRETQEHLLRANNALELLAREDSLTGVANRRELEYTVQAEFKRALRGQHHLGILMLDIDHFKLFNDCYGHQMGDECLRRVSAIMKTTISRPSDLLARYGGEEFIVVLPHTDIDGCMVIARNIRKAIFDAAIPHTRAPLGILTVSVGLHSIIPTEDDSIEGLVAAADKALYQAKSAGRNQCIAA